jgi:hypothetical protein
MKTRFVLATLCALAAAPLAAQPTPTAQPEPSAPATAEPAQPASAAEVTPVTAADLVQGTPVRSTDDQVVGTIDAPDAEGATVGKQCRAASLAAEQFPQGRHRPSHRRHSRPVRRRGAGDQRFLTPSAH